MKNIFAYIFDRHRLYSMPTVMPQREVNSRLKMIPDWKNKNEYCNEFLYKKYTYSKEAGSWLLNGSKFCVEDKYNSTNQPFTKVNYACGVKLMDSWLNVDCYKSDAANYRCVDLFEKHPFGDNSIIYGFAEDFLEHLTQAQSLFFLSEIYRTLISDGVFRLSFPGIEGVLKRAYSPVSEETVRKGEIEAYMYWDHIHFYSKDELELVARHFGFRDVKFVEYGKSYHSQLCNLDTRPDQIGLNTYAELTK